MIGTLMDRMLDQRLLVVAGAVALLLGGLYTFQYLNIEAYPDPSPPTIEVIAQNPGWSAEEMERQITVPIEIQLNGMPGARPYSLDFPVWAQRYQVLFYL